MKNYGIIGFPLGHSFSRDYFTKKFETENIDAKFINFEIENCNEIIIIRNIPNLLGLSVTIPYKENIIPFLTELSEEAQEIGAVNSIKVRENFLKGYNTDYLGFRDSLLEFIDEKPENALVLGTGGASKAVQYTLKKLGINYKVVSRTPSDNEISYKEVKYYINDYNLIINTTPLGMYPKVNNSPDIPYEKLTFNHYIYDLVYNPAKTEFLAKSEKQGAKICNGLNMLYKQAEYSWKLWNE